MTTNKSNINPLDTILIFQEEKETPRMMAITPLKQLQYTPIDGAAVYIKAMQKIQNIVTNVETYFAAYKSLKNHPKAEMKAQAQAKKLEIVRDVNHCQMILNELIKNYSVAKEEAEVDLMILLLRRFEFMLDGFNQLLALFDPTPLKDINLVCDRCLSTFEQMRELARSAASGAVETNVNALPDKI